MQDLFKTKEELLFTWCSQQGFFSKADVMAYALKNYYLRADRTVRTLVGQGKLRKLPKDECAFRNLQGKMAYYEIVR